MTSSSSARANGLVALGLVCGLALGCFPTKPGPRLAHFEQSAPAIGAAAPDFELPALDGSTLRLADWIGERPVVLVLGSETCPVFRHRRHWLRGLERRYRGRAHFLAVFTREAHPVGSPSPYTGEEWDLWVNWISGVRVHEPLTLDARIAQARRASDALGLRMPAAVDRMDDAVWRAYGAASAPAFVIDREGRIAARQVWSDPGDLRGAIDELLADASR